MPRASRRPLLLRQVAGPCVISRTQPAPLTLPTGATMRGIRVLPPQDAIDHGHAHSIHRQSRLSGIDPKRAVAIYEVVHKAFVNVSERGTETAAATGLTARANALRMTEQAVIFRADHPFIFLIRDTRTEVALFVGRLMKPR